MEKKFSKKDCIVSETKIVYQGYFSIAQLKLKYRLYNGGWVDLHRDLIKRHPASAILPYDPHLDRVILIEQFRIGAIEDDESPWQVEIPAGVIDSEETPEQVAIRETKEEAGCDVTNVQLLYDFYVSPGASNEYIHIFYGEVDSKGIDGIHGLKNELEDIRVLNLSRKEAFDYLSEGKIKNMPSVIALQWLELNYQRLIKPKSE